MHLSHVEIFCDVVNLRSFSKAAQLHNVSQPSASQAVHLLEKRLGVDLLDRSKRPFELTPAGKVYYEGCRELLENFRKVEDCVLRMRDKIVGLVRIAAIYSVGLLQMDCYTKHFEELYPEAEVEVRYLHPDEVYERLQNDEADIGLVSFPKTKGELTVIPWQQQEMVLAAPTQHRLAGRESIPVAEMNGENFIAFTPELSIRQQIDRWLKQSKVAVEIVHEFDNIENIKSAVEIGSGVSLLPLPTLRRELEVGALAAIRLENVRWARPLGIVQKRHRTPTAAVSRFLELLRQDPETFSRNGSGSGRNGEIPLDKRLNGDGHTTHHPAAASA